MKTFTLSSSKHSYFFTFFLTLYIGQHKDYQAQLALGHSSVSILRKWSEHPFQFSWNFAQIVITPYDEHLQNLNEVCQEMAWL